MPYGRLSLSQLSLLNQCCYSMVADLSATCDVVAELSATCDVVADMSATRDVVVDLSAMRDVVANHKLNQKLICFGNA